MTGPGCTCGCASVGLALEGTDAPPARLKELSANAVEGSYAVGFRLLLTDDCLNDVKSYGYGDSDNTTWPPAALIS